MGLLCLGGAICSLILVQKLTPKKLLILGLSLVLMLLISLAITVNLAQFVAARFSVLAYAFVYAMSVGPIVFMIVPLFLPPCAVAMAFVVNGLSRYVTSQTFLYLQNSIAGISGAFCIYGCVTLIGLCHCYFELPETQGKRFIEILREFYKPVALLDSIESKTSGVQKGAISTLQYLDEVEDPAPAPYEMMMSSEAILPPPLTRTHNDLVTLNEIYQDYQLRVSLGKINSLDEEITQHSQTDSLLE